MLPGNQAQVIQGIRQASPVAKQRKVRAVLNNSSYRASTGVQDSRVVSRELRDLVERGLADGLRLMITGGSAGGYTTLCALTFRDRFKAGASHFGVSDCEALATETHKFASCRRKKVQPVFLFRSYRVRKSEWVWYACCGPHARCTHMNGGYWKRSQATRRWLSCLW